MTFFTRLIGLFIRPKNNTAIHKEYKRLIERVAVVDGRDLYAFVELGDMPHNRYNKCTRFRSEFNMRLDRDFLDFYIENQEKAIDSGKMRNVTNALSELKMRKDMLYSAAASYRLASCVYFWEDEDLTDYDFEVGDDKIERFKKIKFEDFFLSEPMNKFLPQMNISVEDLRVYSEFEKELKKLTSQQLSDRKESLNKTTT